MNINWKEIVFITVAGGIGGCLSLVYSITVGNPPTVELPVGILAYIFLGMGAGFLGVYVIAKTDTSQFAHALGFAIACGLSWAPIMDASTALIKQNTEKQLAHETEYLSKKVKIEKEKVKDASGDNLSVISERIGEYSEQLAKIVDSANAVETISKANHVLSSIGEVVAQINERDKKLASITQKKIYGVIANVNAKSVANLDIPLSLKPKSIFNTEWPVSGYPAYRMAIGVLEKEGSDKKVLIIQKEGEG
ncbi:hypothetical protein [Zooshikella sp. RANM57]|uniref:hypothetical protein n=1 Tax=Zooshikella sp. RANM57 TaxID=3425863 RepID=UPI003D6F2BC8